MAISGRKFRKPKKGRIRQVVEYAGVYAVLLFVRLVPFRVGRAVGRLAGDAFFFLSRRRRLLALDNLRMAFGTEKGPAEIRAIARRSVHSFVMTCFEVMWVAGQPPVGKFQARMDEFEEGRRRIREIYDKAGGII